MAPSICSPCIYTVCFRSSIKHQLWVVWRVKWRKQTCNCEHGSYQSVNRQCRGGVSWLCQCVSSNSQAFGQPLSSIFFFQYLLYWNFESEGQHIYPVYIWPETLLAGSIARLDLCISQFHASYCESRFKCSVSEGLQHLNMYSKIFYYHRFLFTVDLLWRGLCSTLSGVAAIEDAGLKMSKI